MAESELEAGAELDADGWPDGTKLSEKLQYSARHGTPEMASVLQSWIPRVKELEAENERLGEAGL
ncbi:unnamed protein product [marine sediment metagenome]|uniref:Uncharacterized protein n=1 Tax=marine sediment metagenome TaxID=412755 RepID=X0VXU4_9ZZZZ